MPRELLSAGVPLDPEVEIERQKRLEALKTTLTGLVARGQGAQAIDQMLSLFVDLERTNDRLAWRVLRAERFRYGRSTERLSREELDQLYLALGGNQATADASPIWTCRVQISLNKLTLRLRSSPKLRTSPPRQSRDPRQTRRSASACAR